VNRSGLTLTLKELVVHHVQSTLDHESAAQPPLSEALRGLTAPEAAWKPAVLRHSIWQIVNHLTLWNRGILRAWDGYAPDEDELRANDWQEVSGSEVDWERDRRTLLDLSAEFLTRARALNDEDLSTRIVWYKDGVTRPLAVRLIRTTTHDTYHADQIMYLRALQGIPTR